MTRKSALTAILATTLAATMNVTALAAGQQYDIMPDGYTFEAEDAGTYIFDFSEGSGTASDATPEQENEVAAQTPADISAYADEVIRLTNAERKKAGLPLLEADDTLMKMAQQRADELLESYSHTRPDGSRCFTVFEDFECELKSMNENIANGQKTPEQVVAAWMASEKGHREAILREDSAYIGTAVVKAPNGKLYWVQLFAK